MLKNILVTSLRNFFRNRIFSLINLIGLSVSMSLGMLIIMLIKEQFAFDNFHKDSDRIYRVNTRLLDPEWGIVDLASAPLSIGQVLKDDYSFSEDVVRISRQLNGDATYRNVNVPLKGILVDPSFLEVFNFPFLKGDPATALLAPNNLVLTKRTAEKFLERPNPLGRPFHSESMVILR